jgi:anthranilate/para-aminobenzoate synthase component I
MLVEHAGLSMATHEPIVRSPIGARLRARWLDVAPDPLAIAWRLREAGLTDLALVHSGLGDEVVYVAALPDRSSHSLDPLIDDDPPPEAGDFGAVPRWVGIVPYEARRTLERPRWSPPDHRPVPHLVEPLWRRYPAVVRIARRSGEVLVVGDRPAAIAELARALGSVALSRAAPSSLGPRGCALGIAPDDDGGEHVARVARARELILAGDLYQVNLARRIGVTFEGDVLTLYQRLCQAAPSRYAALMDVAGIHVVATSPELLLRAAPMRQGAPDGAWPRFAELVTEPIKGTRPRGADARADAALVRALEADAKERAELAMIIDVERNDLGKVCRVGSVRLVAGPEVVTHRTVHHRRARLVGLARADVSRAEVIEAMVPSGSVTGAPKVRAMEVIRSLETHRRGLYTGGYGYVSHDGGLLLAMAIRTLTLRAGHGHYFTGGGIVARSDPRAEWRETGWKALQLVAASAAR